MDFSDFSIITPAFADAGAGGFDFMGLLPLVLVFVVMYFLLIRPQQKKAQNLKQMQQGLKRGDQVLMNGGIFGEVTKVVNPDEAHVQIASGVNVRIATSMVGTIFPGGTSSRVESAPAAANSSAKKAPARKATPAKTVTRKTSEKKPTAKKTVSRTKSKTAAKK